MNWMVQLVWISVYLEFTAPQLLTLCSTLIFGKTEFAEFTMVVMVNDIAVDYYDSNKKKCQPWGNKKSHYIDDTETELLALDIYGNLKRTSHLLENHLNKSQELHIFQQLLMYQLDDNSSSKFAVFHAYNGEEVSAFDILSQSRKSVPQCTWTKSRMETKYMVYTNMYQPICEKTLGRYVQDKNTLQKKEPTSVTLRPRTDTHIERTQVTCLATGFYPRNISVTLLRDCQPVPDQELTGGGVLPNGDGTYQLRRSLSVSEEELRERHLYTCTVKHLSVDDSIDLNWEPEFGTDSRLICVVPIFILIGIAIIVVTAIVLHKCGVMLPLLSAVTRPN